MMREVLTSKEVHYVIVLADHRFSRNHADTMNLVDRLRKEGKNLICVADRINTENANDLEYLRYKSIHSERQRHEILFNCMYGLRQRAKEGLYSGGKVTGYYMHNGHLKIDSDGEGIVKEIFDKCANDNWGFKKIAKHMNSIGYKTVNNELFDVASIKSILSNPLYIGYIRFEDKIYDGKHEPIIDREIWEKAQKNLAIRSYIPEKIHPGSYFLAGLLKCPHCGSSMVYHKSSNKKYQYYQCYIAKGGKSSTCNSNLVYRAYAEESILYEISSLLQTPPLYKILLEKLAQKLSTNRMTMEKSISHTKKFLNKIEKDIARTYTLYYKSNNDVHLRQIERLESDRTASNARLEATIIALESMKEINVKSVIDQLIFDFPQQFKRLDEWKQKELLQKIIERIEVTEGSHPKDRKINGIIYHVTAEEIASLLLP